MAPGTTTRRRRHRIAPDSTTSSAPELIPAVTRVLRSASPPAIGLAMALALMTAALQLGWSTAALALIPDGDITIRLEPVAFGLRAPIMVTHATDGSNRLFIVDQ